VVLLIILISLLPTFHEAWKHWRGRSKQPEPVTKP